jgi:hypothetical protein
MDICVFLAQLGQYAGSERLAVQMASQLKSETANLAAINRQDLAPSLRHRNLGNAAMAASRAPESKTQDPAR